MIVARSCAFALCLFLFYSALLCVEPLRKRFAVQSQWQENIVRAQEYPLTASRKPGVIVGSSLAAKLSGTALEGDFYNLSFAAEGPFTGLEIVRRHPSNPRVVLIETNLLLREADQNVVNSVFRPVISDLRPLFPAMRERYQPANLMIGAVGARMVTQVVQMRRKLWPVMRSKQDGKEGVKPLFEQSLAMKITQYNTVPRTEVLKRRTSQMEVCVRDLESRGTRCVFVEMPVDFALLELPRSARVRDELVEAFPPSKYMWIGPEAGRRYVTTDGVHLARLDTLEFAEKIRAELERNGLL